MRISGRQLSLTILAAFFLLAAVVVFALFVLAPNTADVYQPFLLTTFIVALFISLVSIAWLLRGVLRPYNQLISEAERAPVVHSTKSQNEAAFVLETFQSVVAQLQDQQKELERLTAEASKRADSAELFSERIVASMPTALVAFDLSGRATLVNTPAHALFASRIEGEQFRMVFQNAPALAEMVDACLQTGQIFRRAEIESSDAKRLGATVAPIDPSESGSKGVLCLITDITEVTHLREQVALKRNLENLGEMSAGLAHEFKNAMAALHGYAQFLQNVDHNEHAKSAADALLQEVRNLSEMTTAFLNFARPQQLQMDDVSVVDLINDCTRELKPLYETGKVELVVKNEAGAASVSADPRMLRQALLNLLRNAAEAFDEDSRERTVFVNLVPEKSASRNLIAITIRDTGPGIPIAHLEKVFIPFFTTKASGHGVGLPLAHRIITQHGGSLSVADAPNGGAQFTIRLLAN